MKIAIAVGRFPLISETFVLNITTRLMERGHDVTVLALNGAAPEGMPAHPDVDRYDVMDRVVLGRRMPKTTVARWMGIGRLRGPLPVLARGLNPFAFGLDAVSLKVLHNAAAIRGEFDVIHAQYANIGAAMEQLRAVGAVRGALVSSFRGNDITGYVDKRGAGFYKRLMANGDYFLANSDHFRDIGIALGFPAQKVETWYSGLDTSRFLLRACVPPVADGVRLVGVGRLTTKKGFDVALRAMARLDASVRLDLVGDGPERGALAALADELGLRERVFFHGTRDSAEIRKILEASHIKLAPCVTGLDGLADGPINAGKEAMAIGLPVVATRHGGIPELVEDGVSGYLVPERDPEALAAAIQRLLDHPENWDEMGKRGAGIVREKFELSARIDRLEEIYATISPSSS
ncbi:MAG: glycosyltransferase [Planctomycetota bacterium]|jgi:colanic acid/amylovoran biosynthesis glycosyltransferase